MQFGADLKWAEVGIENVKKLHKAVILMILSIFDPTSLQPKSLLLQPNDLSLSSPLKWAEMRSGSIVTPSQMTFGIGLKCKTLFCEKVASNSGNKAEIG